MVRALVSCRRCPLAKAAGARLNPYSSSKLETHMDPARNLPHSGDITANSTLHSHGLRMMTKDDEIKRMVVMNLMVVVLPNPKP